MLEKVVETYLRDTVKQLGGASYKFISPGNNGVPDRICILPGGKVLFVECKQPNGRLSAVQEIQIAKLRALGCKVAVVWSKEDVKKLIGGER